MSRACPFCGSDQFEIIKNIRMQILPGIRLPSEYQIVSCTQCGGCYANVNAAQEDYDHYYSSYNNYSGQGVDTQFDQIVSFIEKFGKSNLELSSQILDIGFGNGDILRHLLNAGYENLSGIDPSIESVEHVKRCGGIRAYCKSIYDEPGLLAGTMDAVFVTSVLEHLLNPQLAVRQACGYIKDGGYLIIDVPDYSMCDRVNLPIANLFNQEHINYFSEQSFRTMLCGQPYEFLWSKLIEINAGPGLGHEYSRAFVLQKQSKKTEQRMISINRDALTKVSIERYFSAQEDQQANINNLIQKWYTEQVPLIIWGVGSWTMSLLATSDLSRCNIVAYVDGNCLKAGMRFSGMNVMMPEEIQNYPDAAIVICAMRYADDIEKEIAKMGLKNPVMRLR